MTHLEVFLTEATLSAGAANETVGGDINPARK